MWRRKRREQDLQDEVNAHLAMDERLRIERGESREDARVNARRDFGNLVQVTEVTRNMWRGAAIERIWQDARNGFRFTVRTLRYEFGVTMLVILTVGIAIGANTTIFSLVNALILRAEFGALFDIGRERGGMIGPLSYPDFMDMRQRNQSFAGLAAYRTSTPFSLTLSEGSEPVYGSLISSNFFAVLGVKMQSGRTFLPEEDDGRATPVAIVSQDLRRRIGDSRDLILNGRRFEIVGVVEESFRAFRMARNDVWIPFGVQPLVSPETGSLVRRGSSWLRLVGRLKDGVTRQSAQAEVTALAAQLDEAYPLGGAGQRSLQVVPHTNFGSSRAVYAMVGTLMGIVILILLIACSNAAGISLAKAMARKREIAVRMAVGAGRGRVIRQLLWENFALFAFAGLAGAIMAWWMNSLLLHGLSMADPLLTIDLSPDLRVASFTFMLTTGTALVFGLGPALQATRLDVVASIKEQSHSANGRSSRVRSTLVVTQIALSFALLVIGGLFLRTMSQAASFDTGFQARNVWAVSLDFALGGHAEAQSRQFSRELLHRVAGSPGVEAASLAMDVPLDGSRSTRDLMVDGSGITAAYNHIAPGYFSALDIPLLQGRDFTDADNNESSPVAIVSRSGATKIWGGADPIGRRLGDMLVVGVAADARTASLGFAEEPAVFYYAPLAQNYQSEQTLLIRAAAGINPVSSVREELRKVSPNTPLLNIRPMSEVVTSGLLSQRLAAWVAGTMGVLGVFLAGAGLYAVTAHGVTRRRREIGIRAALGASRSVILGLVLRQGMVLTVTGLIAGSVFAVALGQLVAGMLFGIGPTDPATFAAAAAVIVLASAAAIFIPSRRAARLDPASALRHE